jgi:L-ascorbate metabolism protein UlaG (beta-lactamase superfamily)
MKALACVILLAVTVFCQTNPSSDEIPTSSGPVRITPIQHASLILEGGGQTIYVDPLGADRYKGLPTPSLVLVTDIHGDHLDRALLLQFKKSGAQVAGPEAVSKEIAGVAVLRNGESRVFGKWKVEAVPMYNVKRGPEPGKVYHEKGRGNGYVLTFGGKRFYISGDTEAIPEMKALKGIDVAFVSMNLPYTMPPDEAAEGVRAFKPRVVYPYHYRGSDLSIFERALAGSGVEVRLRDWYK